MESSVESEHEWRPGGIVERFEFSKMALKVASRYLERLKHAYARKTMSDFLMYKFSNVLAVIESI